MGICAEPHTALGGLGLGWAGRRASSAPVELGGQVGVVHAGKSDVIGACRQAYLAQPIGVEYAGFRSRPKVGLRC